jgi:ABC-type transport system involved in multi-copper enzyme maturation permease subunit
MIQSLSTLAWNGFREARRNRVTVIVAAFAVAMVLAAVLLTEATVTTLQRVLTDLGLGSMSLMLTLLAIFPSTGLLSKEIERRTIFMIVSRPISRALFLVARFAGNMLTLAVILSLMAALFLAEVWLYRFPIHQAQLVSMAALWLELLVLTSVGFVMSSFSSQIVSAVVTSGVYFGGHLSSQIYILSGRSDSSFLRALGKVIYYLLPNLESLNFRPQAAYAVRVTGGEIWNAVAVGVGYSAVMIGLAVLIFSRRDFK